MRVTRQEYEEAVEFLNSASSYGYTSGDGATDALRAAERQAESIIEEWAEQQEDENLL